MQSDTPRVQGIDHETTSMPVRADDLWMTGTDDDGNVFQQIGTGQTIVSLEKEKTVDKIEGLEEHGLERFENLAELDVDLSPFPFLTGRGASLIDGRLHLAFIYSAETHEAYSLPKVIAEMQFVAFQAADNLKNAGCVLRWTKNDQLKQFDIELHVPEDAMRHLNDEEELADAISEALIAPDFSGRHSLKKAA